MNLQGPFVSVELHVIFQSASSPFGTASLGSQQSMFTIDRLASHQGAYIVIFYIVMECVLDATALI